MSQNLFYIIITLFASIVAIYNTYEWNKKRKIQKLVDNLDNEELKTLALATNTIGWVAGGKFGTDEEKYYLYALKSLSNHKYLINSFPSYKNDNLREYAFEVYKILKDEMRKKFTKEELEISQIWAAMKILDVKNYIINNKTPSDIDKEHSL